MNLFKRLFSSGSKLDPIDFSLLKTDLHSHLIPGIDDGSKSMEDSLNMLRQFQNLGYTKVITTPHVMSDFYKNTPEIILGGLEKVREAIQAEGLTIKIEAAAEYYLDFKFEELIQKQQVLTFGESHVLFELSFNDEPPRVKETIFSLITGGYKPILAHIERYPFYINRWDTIEDFRERGVLLQLNINSLSGHYGPAVKKMGEQLIDKGWIDVVGSDCHHMGHLNMMESLATNPYVHKVVAQPNLLNKFL